MLRVLRQVLTLRLILFLLVLAVFTFCVLFLALHYHFERRPFMPKPSSTPTNSSLSYPRLVEGYTALGAYVSPKIQSIAIENEGTGIIATSPLLPKEMIMSIPESVFITEKRVLEVVPAFQDLTYRIVGYGGTPLFIAQVRAGFRGEHTDPQQILKPIEYENLRSNQDCYNVFHFSKPVLERMPWWARQTARKTQRFFDLTWKQLKQYWPQHLGRTTSDQLKDALCTLWSRTFSVNGTWAIVPVIDLFNHRWNANAKYRYEVERHAHEGYTEQFFFPGEQLFFSYGTCDHHSPTRFFMTYNFFDAYPLDRLSSDFQQEIPLRFPIVHPKIDPNWEVKKKILHALRPKQLAQNYELSVEPERNLWLAHLLWRPLDIGIVRMLLLPPELFNAYNVNLALQAGMGKVRTFDGWSSPGPAPITEELEASVEKYLAAACDAALDEVPYRDDLPSPRDPSEAWAASQADRLMLYTRQLLTFCYNFYRAPYA